MYLTQHLDYRCLILCTLPCFIRLPTSLLALLLALLLAIGLHTSRPHGSFPCPHELTPTHSTTRLASQTKPPLQSAPSELYLVRVHSCQDRLGTHCVLGSCLGIRSNKPVSYCTHIPPLLEIPFPPVCVDERRIPILSAHG